MGHEADHSPSSKYRGRENVDLYTHFPLRLHGVVLTYAQGQLYFYIPHNKA
jgi:hypothetical protein